MSFSFRLNEYVKQFWMKAPLGGVVNNNQKPQKRLLTE